MEGSKLKTVFVLYLAGAIALNAMIIWQVHDSILQGYSDFAALYAAGKLVQQGRASEMYDRRAQWQVQQEFAATVKIRRGPLPYVRPPFESLLFWPFAYLKYPLSCVLWGTVNLVTLLTIPFVLRSVRGEPEAISPGLGGVIALAFFPVAFDLLQGQDAVVLLLVFSFVFAFLRRGADFQSGMCLGAGLFKFHLIIPIALIFLLRRKTRFVLGFLTTALILVLVSATVVGWATLVGYPRYLWDLNRATGVGFITVRSMPNIRGLFAAFGAYQNSPVVTGVLWAVEVCGIIFTAYIWRPGRHDDQPLLAVGFSLSIVVTILTSFYVYAYDMTLMLIPILQLGSFFLRDLKKRPWSHRLLVSCIALLLLTPIYWVVIFRFDRFYWMALVLLIVALSLALIAESRRKLGDGLRFS